jgi:hypothetical protein
MRTSVSSDENAAVREQLERILSSATFRNSKRYPNLLRHIVERTLEGRITDLKERTIGVEVFGRPADYDTSIDPVVRVTAGEVRNRIARYYHEPGREKEIRIELQPGSYIPEFHFPAPVVVVEEAIEVAEPSIADAKLLPAQPRKHPWSFLGFLLLGGVMVISALAWWHPWAQPRIFDRFWGPFLTGSSPVTICVARPGTSSVGAGRPPDTIAYWDVSAAVKVACFLEKAGGHQQLRREDEVTFEDLRRAPAVLIGALNDAWAIRFTEDLRFKPQEEGSLRWILDRKNPTSRTWSINSSNGSFAGQRSTYAVISKLLMARSDKPVLMLAGLTGPGTATAGDFVTDRSFLERLEREAPPGWEGKNMQVVTEAEVIDNHPGPPRILAVHVW